MEETFDPKIFLKCAECTNFEDVNQLQNRTKRAELRLDAGDKRFKIIEDELSENNRITYESHNMVVEMHDLFFKDKNGQISMKTTMALNNNHLKNLWSIVIFIIVSLAGLTFFLIQKNLEPRNKEGQSGMMFVPYQREENPFFKRLEKDKK